jgi:hypothetical protein
MTLFQAPKRFGRNSKFYTFRGTVPGRAFMMHVFVIAKNWAGAKRISDDRANAFTEARSPWFDGGLSTFGRAGP